MKKQYQEKFKVTAVQYDGLNWDEIDEFMGEEGLYFYGDILYNNMFLKMRVEVGDYVFRTENGINKCLSKANFENHYEEIKQ